MVGTRGARFYRAVCATQIEAVLAPVASPEGRFHHCGQAALYLSESIDGVRVAIATSLRAGDPPRLVAPLEMSGGTLFDVRREEALRALGIAPGAGSVRRQEDRAAGAHANALSTRFRNRVSETVRTVMRRRRSARRGADRRNP